jgi:PAS domain S-box-containing protein
MFEKKSDLREQLNKALQELKVCETRSHDIMDKSVHGILIVDDKGIICFANQAAAKIFDCTVEELLGEHHGFPSVSDISAKTTDLNLKSHSGKTVAVEMWGAEIPWKGQPAHFVALHDITARKKMEEALRESEELFHATFNQAAVGIAHLAPDGHLLRINQRYCEIVGYPEEELGKMTFQQITHPDDLEMSITQFDLLRAGKLRDFSLEKRYICKDGSLVWVYLTVSMVYDPDGKQRYIVSVIEDITERKLAEEALRFSEARYRALHRDNPTMIATIDADLTILSVNPTCASQLGYSIDELEGQPVLALFHEDDRPAVTEQLRMCLRNSDQVYRWQFRKVRKDGGLLWVEELAQTVYDLNGAPNVLIVCQDITERKQAEEALQKSEKKFSKIFHSTPALLAISTLAEGKFIDVNETCLRILGYQREELVGRTSLELGIWESNAARGRMIRDLKEQGAVHDQEITFTCKGGKTFIGLFSAELIDINGERYMLSMVNDITERKLMGEEIERLNTDLAARAAELESANRELEAFNYTVSHDLRKPLTNINSYCQVIQEMCGGSLGEPCQGYVQEIYEGTLRMNELIDTLLNFSQLMRNELNREPVDLSGIAKTVAAELQLTETGRRVSFRIAERMTAYGDANLLRVVLENLLGNAWKYTGAREEAVIEFGVAEIDGKQASFVRDNGAGFDMKYAEKLFIPFQRLPGADEFKGHGIGLATVERIIRRHGGRVWAEGEPDKGATFYFSL